MRVVCVLGHLEILDNEKADSFAIGSTKSRIPLELGSIRGMSLS